MLDEPDAHREVIKQANVYHRLSHFAKRKNSQLLIARHSESVLNAAKGDLIISSMSGEFEAESPGDIKAFLVDYPYEQYLLAKQKPFILYYEDSTDLTFIRSFCQKSGKQDYLKQLETGIYLFPLDGNSTSKAKKHFSALKQYLPDLKGFALFDNLGSGFQDIPEGLKMYQWQRREIENYIPVPDTLINYIEKQPKDLFSQNHPSELKRILEENIPPIADNDLTNDFWIDSKMSDFSPKFLRNF